METNIRLCELCVALAREDEGPYRTAYEIAADAAALLSAADTARKALAAGRSAKVAYGSIDRIARHYRARLAPANEDGRIGLRLMSGNHAGPRGAFYALA